MILKLVQKGLSVVSSQMPPPFKVIVFQTRGGQRRRLPRAVRPGSTGRRGQRSLRYEVQLSHHAMRPHHVQMVASVMTKAVVSVNMCSRVDVQTGCASGNNDGSDFYRLFLRMSAAATMGRACFAGLSPFNAALPMSVSQTL